jgi:hypothetical protein
MTRNGKKIRPDRTTMETPITQITCMNMKSGDRLNVQPMRTSVNSRNISQIPRLKTYAAAWFLVLVRRLCHKTSERPTRKTKVGAQICVTQRVIKRTGWLKSLGSKLPAVKKSRVWSSAIRSITKPRSTSIASILECIVGTMYSSQMGKHALAFYFSSKNI